ncbi:MAG: hypothetical protein ABJB74_19745 [Gemmatimonas sp.]
MTQPLLFRRRDRMTFASLLLVVATTAGHSQAAVVIPASGGIQYRYHGDTVWRERDTTVTRSLYRQDTLYRSTFSFGRTTSSDIYVALGDSVALIESRDASGKIVTSSRSRFSGVTYFDSDRFGIEGAIRNAAQEVRSREGDARINEMNERAIAAGRSPMVPPTTPTVPLSPSTKVTYPFSANRTLEQHGDTVWNIVGCAARPPVETTVYLLFASDSVRRLSPSPRTFDAMMARAVRADIASVFLRQRVRPADNPAMRGVPNLNKWPCDRR